MLSAITSVRAQQVLAAALLALVFAGRMHWSVYGTFRTYGTGLMMSADWSEEDNTSLRRYFRV
jgi:hypothetical protein